MGGTLNLFATLGRVKQTFDFRARSSYLYFQLVDVSVGSCAAVFCPRASSRGKLAGSSTTVNQPGGNFFGDFVRRSCINLSETS